MNWVLVAIAGLLLAWIVWGAYVTFSAERVPYEVLARVNGVEVREYPARLTATVTAESRNEAFRVLAGFIFGGNEPAERIRMTAPVRAKEKIAMTAPVKARENGGVTMTFYMPEKYSKKTLPRPTAKEINISKQPAQRIAAVKFPGYAFPAVVKKQKAHLLGVLKENDMKAKGEPFLLFYNDPWTPPFMRRNEIAVVLA